MKFQYIGILGLVGSFLAGSEALAVTRIICGGANQFAVIQAEDNLYFHAPNRAVVVLSDGTPEGTDALTGAVTIRPTRVGYDYVFSLQTAYGEKVSGQLRDSAIYPDGNVLTLTSQPRGSFPSSMLLCK